VHVFVNSDAQMLCLVIQETSAECSRYKLGKYTCSVTPLGHYVHVVLSWKQKLIEQVRYI